MRRSRWLGALWMLGSLARSAAADAPAPATLPTPYSAEQIRDAWQPGLRVETRTTETGAETRVRMTVVAAGAETCKIRRELLDSSGAASEAPREFTAKWSELRDHALFETAKATRERADCRSQLGALPGWRYEVAMPDQETVRMCFADETPGPPVEYERLRGGEVLSRTEHTHYERVASGAEEKR